MKVLIVASNNQNNFAPFIVEQVESLRKQGIICEYFGIIGKSIIGYLKNLKSFKNKLREFQPDLIHAHYGLSGLFANLQRKIPVVSTYHGSDINKDFIYPLSCLSMLLSKHNIFVNKNKRIVFKKKSSIIPCGIDLKLFKPNDKTLSRKKLNLALNQKHVLFSSSFGNKIKNPSLAIEAVNNLTNIHLIELKGYSREEVALLMNAVDVALLTSYSEGSPQFIKEAMACNKPIVATDVGDIHLLFGIEEGHFITNFSINEVSQNLEKALLFEKQFNSTKGRKRMIELNLDSKSVASKIVEIYKQLI